MFVGIILALSSGIALGSITSFAALSYQHGVEPLGLIFLRGMIAAVIMVAVCRFNKEPMVLKKGGGKYALMIGTALSMVGFGYMSSVAFISPGLAVAILFLFPLIVLTIDSMRLRKMPPLTTILGFGVALVGIISCVGVGGALHPLGIMLALIASCGMAFFLLSSSAASAAGHGSGNIIWANMMIVTLALIASAFSQQEGAPFIALPVNTIGVMAIFAAAGLYALGILLSMFALRIAPAPLVALFLNIEPLTTLVAARIIVNEELSLFQYAGMIMAVVGIVLGSLSMRRQPR